MNYQKIYHLIIEKADNRCILPYKYSEKHHIIPKCVGGNDSQDNIVELYPEEHYVCHQLLVKLYPENFGLIKSCQMMSVSSNQVIRNNKLYSWIRKRNSKLTSERMKGKNHPMYGKKFSADRCKKISNALKGVPKSEEHKRKIGINASKCNKGVPKSEEHKRKISIGNKGISKSEEHKRKLSIINLNKPKVSCLVCRKVLPWANFKQHWNSIKCNSHAVK